MSAGKDAGDFYSHENWFIRRQAEMCVNALRKRGFAACFAPDREEARRIVLEHIPLGASVGIGGSVTVRDLGLDVALKERGHKLYDHWDSSLDPHDRTKAHDNQILAGVFLSGTNAVTEDGVLVNTDGSGNRVAAMIFGPEVTVVVCGYNKIVRDVPSAIDRIRKYAAPVNCKRLGVQSPCQSGGDCFSCGNSAQLCRATTILEGVPGGKKEFVVVIVGEKLGY